MEASTGWGMGKGAGNNEGKGKCHFCVSFSLPKTNVSLLNENSYLHASCMGQGIKKKKKAFFFYFKEKRYSRRDLRISRRNIDFFFLLLM